MSFKICFILHSFSVFFMTGVIWIIQVLNYPFIRHVSKDNYLQFYAQHTARITPIVGPIMIIQLATAFALVLFQPKGFYFWGALTLTGIVFLATIFFSVPYHSILAAGFQIEAHQKLVNYNWVRTVVWTIHSGLLIWGAFHFMTFEPLH